MRGVRHLGICLGFRVGLPDKLYTAPQPPHRINFDAWRAGGHTDDRLAALHNAHSGLYSRQLP